VERQPEQALLEESVHHGVGALRVGQVEEGLGQELAVGIDDPDGAGALDDEDAAAAIVRRRDVGRIGETIATLTNWTRGSPGRSPPGSATWEG
jgi:hypothetical protein